MKLNEKFEVEFKNKYSSQQRNLLLNAIKDLYINLNDYKIIERNDVSKDQTLRFMDNNYISKNEIADLIENYAFNLNVCEWGDILKDRDREDNLLYILYIPKAKIGNWDYSKSKEKLLYIKWNPINKNILSFHTMKKVHETNRDELEEKRMRFVEDKFEIYNTHDKYKYINRWCNLYYDKVSENLFVLYDGYIEIVDQMKFSEFKHVYDEYTLCKSTDKIVQIWKKDRKLEEKLSLQQIRSRDIYSKNAHVNKFYSIRKDLVGNPNKNIKFITSQLNDDGSADFLFQTVVTPYEDPNHVYKSLNDAPVSNIINSGSMSTDTSGEYMMCLRINDFWDLIEEFEVIEKNEFNKNTLSAILDLSEDVKYSCNCSSFVWTGISYYATLEDASLIPNTIAPKVWNKYRDGALCCKHLSGLFRTLSFQINLMAMSIKKNMKDQGLLI